MKLKPLFALLALLPLLTACPPAPAFTFTLDPAVDGAPPGGSTTTTATITPQHGFLGEVAFSLAAPPEGITLTGGPATVTGAAAVTAELTIAVAAGVAAGDYALTVEAAGGGLTRTATFTLTVTPLPQPPPPPAPTFTFTLDPAEGRAAPGGSTTTTATITPQHGFLGEVAFSLAAPPEGITLTGGPATVTGAAAVTAELTIAVAAGVAAGDYALTVEAAGGGLTRTATFTLTVPPFRQGALAGTFVANSNSPTVRPFDGNILFIAITNFDGTRIARPVEVTITVPGIGSFPYVFDPARAINGVVGLILRDFEAGLGPLAAGDNAVAQALSRHLGIPVEVVALERPAFAPQAAVGGDFVFAFPDLTLVRTVDVNRKLAVPVVGWTHLAPNREALITVFNEAPGAIGYRLVAFGRGSNAHAGTATVANSPALITLSGALEPNERFVVEVTAFRDPPLHTIFANPEIIFAAVSQVDISQHLHYSE